MALSQRSIPSRAEITVQSRTNSSCTMMPSDFFMMLKEKQLQKVNGKRSTIPSIVRDAKHLVILNVMERRLHPLLSQLTTLLSLRF